MLYITCGVSTDGCRNACPLWRREFLLFFLPWNVLNETCEIIPGANFNRILQAPHGELDHSSFICNDILFSRKVSFWRTLCSFFNSIALALMLP